MADSTYRVGVFLDLAAGRYRRGAKAAAKDTDRLGGSLRKAAGSGSLMGRRVERGARAARREVRGTAEESQRLGRALERSGRDGERSLGRLARQARAYRTEMGLAARAAGRLRGVGFGLAGAAGLGFGGVAAFRNVLTLEQRYARLEIQAGATAKQMDMVRKVVQNTASDPNIRLDRSSVLAAIEEYVKRTGDLAAAINSIEPLSQAIQGFGGPGTGAAFGGIAAELQKLGIVNEQQVRQALNLFAAQGKQGAFPVGALATEAPAVLSAASALGFRGIEGAREVGALLQSAQATIANPAEAATATEAFLRTFSDLQKIEAIWEEFGVNVQDAGGRTRPLSAIIRDLLQATGGDPVELSRGGIFDQTAIRAMPRTMEAFAWHEGIRTMEVPPTLISDASARMAETTGAKIQETKTDVEDWMQDNLEGPLGEVVTALTSFKDELLVGVGLLAGSWYAFKGLRAAGGLLWRLAGRRGGGLPPGATSSPSGRGPTGPARGTTRAAMREFEAARAAREQAARRTPSLMRAASGGTGLAGGGRAGWSALMPAGGGRAGWRAAMPAGGGRAGWSALMPAGGGRAGWRAAMPAGGGRAGWRAAMPAGGGRAGWSALMPAGGGRAGWRAAMPAGGGRAGWSALMPAGGGRAGWRAAMPAGGGRAGWRAAMPAGGGRAGWSALMPAGGGRAGWRAAMPAGGGRAGWRAAMPGKGRANQSWLSRMSGGWFRTLARGLGPASAGAMMGLTAHDIATGAIPDDQVAPEVGGLAGGLGGSWMAALVASRLMKSLPGPVRFGGGLLAGLGGWMGGESAGRAATKAVFDPGWVSPDSVKAADNFYSWLDRVSGRDQSPESPEPPEIGNWRGVGRRARRRSRLDVGRNRPEVAELPLPRELESARRSTNRGRLDVGRSAPKVEVTINMGDVISNASDPREVAEEVADEIERRMRDRALGLRDVLLADPTPEAQY